MTLSFTLWLEFEEYADGYPGPSDDPFNDFANIAVYLDDGRRYALNVWTFLYLQSAWESEYLVAPDLIVARLDRPTLERIVQQMIENDELKAEWLCMPDEKEHNGNPKR